MAEKKWEKYLGFDGDGFLVIKDGTLWLEIEQHYTGPNGDTFRIRRKKPPGGGDNKVNSMCSCRKA